MDSSSSLNQNSSHQKNPKVLRKITRFDQDAVEDFYEVFEKNPYPTRGEIFDLSLRFDESRKRIQEWFRAQRKRTCMRKKKTIKKKTVFEREEQKILWEHYKRLSYPSQEEFQSLAEKLHCQVKSVKNWYYYRRRSSYKAHHSSKDKLQHPSIKSEYNNPQSTDVSDQNVFKYKVEEPFQSSSHSNSLSNQETNKQNPQYCVAQTNFQPTNMQIPNFIVPNNFLPQNQVNYACMILPKNTLMNQLRFQSSKPMFFSNLYNMNRMAPFNNINTLGYINNVYSG